MPGTYRRSTIAGLFALVLLGPLAGCTQGEPASTGAPSTVARSTPSIKLVYPSAPGGKYWQADWSGADVYGWSNDPWVQISGNERYRTKDGVLTISGETSRLYVRDPDEKRQWGNVEITVYAKRIDDAGVPYSGIVTEARTNHGMTGSLEDNPCDSRGLSARLRFDGSVDFGKETSHPNTVATKAKTVFPGGLPHDIWIGYKHVIYDIPGGTRQELWMDLTNGKDGGDWRLVASHNDRKGSLGKGEPACADGIDPALPLTIGPRPGSESGLPNLSVLFRADDIGMDGLQYRDASIREIEAPAGG